MKRLEGMDREAKLPQKTKVEGTKKKKGGEKKRDFLQRSKGGEGWA